MSRYVGRVLTELLFYRRSSMAATRQFSDWGHNEDLCPRLEAQLNEIRGCFLKHQAIAYDVQGFHDLGTDVLLRYRPSDADDQDELRYISFQVKSNDDLKARDYLKDLRSQAIQVCNEYPTTLDQYYILLCADARLHRDRIREIKKSFSNMKKVLVVDPVHSLTFLRLGSPRIASVVDRLLKEEDDVLKQAVAAVEDMSPTQAGIFVAAIAQATLTEIRNSVDLKGMFRLPFIETLYRSAPDLDYGEIDELAEEGLSQNSEEDDEEQDDSSEGAITPPGAGRDYYERFVEDADKLVDNVFVQHGSSGDMVEIIPEHCRPIQALLLDANVRYGYDGEEAIRFVFGMLQVMKRYGLYLPGEEEELTGES